MNLNIIHLRTELFDKFTKKFDMRYWLTIISLFTISLLQAQKKIDRTVTIKLSGDIKNERVLNYQDILGHKTQSVGTLAIVNHAGEKRSTLKNLKGVLLKDVLGNIEYETPSPKQLSEFYFTIVASDQYKVVYSWNELFNSPTGNTVYLITEKEGTSIEKMEDAILLVSTSDFKTGRRHVKAVSEIRVSRVK